MNNYTDRCLEIIEKLEARSSSLRRSAKLTIDMISELTVIFEQIDDKERLIVTECIIGKTGLLLIDFSCDAAEKAINYKDANWLKVAVLTHIIEDFRYDYRENILRLYLIEYAAWKINADILKILRSLKKISAPESFYRLENFFKHNLGARALKFSGLKEIKKNGKTIFVQA